MRSSFSSFSSFSSLSSSYVNRFRLPRRFAHDAMSARPDECAHHLADRVRQLEDAIAVLSKRQSQLELELLSKRGTAEPNEGAPAPKSEMATIKSSEPARVHESDAARTTANQLASGSDTAQSSSQPRMRSGPYAGSRSWGASITQLTFLVGGMRGIYSPVSPVTTPAADLPPSPAAPGTAEASASQPCSSTRGCFLASDLRGIYVPQAPAVHQSAPHPPTPAVYDKPLTSPVQPSLVRAASRQPLPDSRHADSQSAS